MGTEEGGTEEEALAEVDISAEAAILGEAILEAEDGEAMAAVVLDTIIMAEDILGAGPMMATMAGPRIMAAHTMEMLTMMILHIMDTPLRIMAAPLPLAVTLGAGMAGTGMDMVIMGTADGTALNGQAGHNGLFSPRGWKN